MALSVLNVADPWSSGNSVCVLSDRLEARFLVRLNQSLKRFMFTASLFEVQHWKGSVQNKSIESRFCAVKKGT